ncbi:hypothetical protein MTO96_048819 [Rhipicephalus appendiculatus]
MAVPKAASQPHGPCQQSHLGMTTSIDVGRRSGNGGHPTPKRGGLPSMRSTLRGTLLLDSALARAQRDLPEEDGVSEEERTS